MEFTLYNPTKLLFGKGRLTEFISKIKETSSKVLLIYGANSLKESGKYDKIIAELKANSISIYELGNVFKPYRSFLDEGIRLCKEHNINGIIGVGSATQMDMAKAISFGVFHDNYWNVMTFEEEPKDIKHLDVFEIVTLSSSGSEMDSAAEIDDIVTKIHGSLYLIHPTMSLIDSNLTTNTNQELLLKGAFVTLIQATIAYISDVRNPLVENIQLSLIKSELQAILNFDEYSQESFSIASFLTTSGFIGLGRGGEYSLYELEGILESYLDYSYIDAMLTTFPYWFTYQYKDNEVFNNYLKVYGASKDNFVTKIYELYKSLNFRFKSIKTNNDLSIIVNENGPIESQMKEISSNDTKTIILDALSYLCKLNMVD